MKKLLFYLLGCFLPLTVQQVFAKHDSIQYALRLSTHKGVIIAHRDTLRQATRGAHPAAIELDFSWLNHSQKGWTTANCYRRTGIVIGYTNYDNPAVLGTGSYLLLYTEPQLTFHKRINFSFTSAVGIIFLSTVYDREQNPTNLFFSNKISGLVRVAFHASYKINDHLQVGAGAHFNHISNGATITPNLGMNYPTASVSASYQFQNNPLVKRQKVKTFDPLFRYSAELLTVKRLIKRWDENSGRKRLIGLALSVSKHFTHLSSWQLGTEISHDASIPATGDLYERQDDPFIVSVAGGHQLTLARFHFSQLIGVYVYKKYDNQHHFFQRYILSYDVLRYRETRVTLGFSLKAHIEVAEMLDMRLGITF